MQTLKRILTVDFDYIMDPCINLYNHRSAGDANATKLWNELYDELDIEPHLSYDAKSLYDITGILTRAVLNGAKFIPIDDHEEVVNHLKKDKYFEDTTFNIINIDFHHDILYNNEEVADIYDRHEYNCANWVFYLMSIDKVDMYTWLKAPNSKGFNGEIISELLGDDYVSQKINVLRKKDICKINVPFDEVYLCKSPQWVPNKYIHLYDILVSVLKEIDKTIDKIEVSSSNEKLYDSVDTNTENSYTDSDTTEEEKDYFLQNKKESKVKFFKKSKHLKDRGDKDES